MHKITCFFCLALLLSFLPCCNTATPENYFDYAVLNTNMMMGFSNPGLERELEQPSVKLVEGTKDQVAPMKRKEIIDNKIQYLDNAFAKINALKETDDTREMLQAAKALYAYVLPVYKKEYVQLAKLYDDNAPAEQVAAYSKTISDTYFPGFISRYKNLEAAGKPYAERHQIKVNWNINTSPAP